VIRRTARVTNRNQVINLPRRSQYKTTR